MSEDVRREQTQAPPAALFVHEDVSRPENRTNLALLGILTIPAFRYWFLGRLGLPPDSIVYPPQNVSGLRPDLVVVGPDGHIRAWIEVELGGENSSQLAAYRATLHGPVKSIVGPEDAATDTSLEELARIAADCLDEVLDRQQQKNVQLFVALVQELRGRSTAWNYVVPNDLVRQEVFLQGLSAELGSALVFAKPPPRPGELLVTTITQKGWTLRAFARYAGFSSVSILWKQSAKALRVPSFERLSDYFGVEVLDPYRAFFLEHFGSDISQIAGSQSHGIPEDDLIEELGAFASVVRGFLPGSDRNPRN